jgi:hypothetical protein
MQKTFAEKEAENFLEKENFNVLKREFSNNKEELKNITKKIDFPWAMKISSKKIIHKKKVGGVILNIKNLNGAQIAFEKLSKIENFEQVIIQPMIKGEEFIVGLKKTPEFNIVIMLGAGGSNVEEKKDISFRICPIKEKDAEEMIKELKIYGSIEKKVNLGLLKNIILKISRLAEKCQNIKELDINPLIINKKEAIIVDVRISFE